MRIVGISVDSPAKQAAMVEKLDLPFPLLSDPDGEEMLKSYDVFNAEERGGIAHPSVIVIRPDGSQVFKEVGRDFADRITEDELLDKVRSLDLPSTSGQSPTPGEPEPSDTAMPVRAMSPYFRGAKFAAIAMGRRFPEAKEESKRYAAQMERYIEAVKTLR